MKAPRAIRGATTIDHDSSDEVMNKTEKLLLEMVEVNDIKQDDIISIMFTATQDIKSAFPAAAARMIGWNDTPLMSAVEMDVKESIGLCVRVMMNVMTEKAKSRIRHIYLGESAKLRPDLIAD